MNALTAAAVRSLCVVLAARDGLVYQPVNKNDHDASSGVGAPATPGLTHNNPAQEAA